MKYFRHSALVVLLFVAWAVPSAAQQWYRIPAKTYSADQYGAVADGSTINTRALQTAIDDISAKGGGQLVFHAGRYVSGTLYLKSNVFLRLDAGAMLLGSTNPMDYVKDPQLRWTSFIFAIGQHNLGVIGQGTIDCRGAQVANNMVALIHQGVTLDDPLKYDRPSEANRPENLHFRNCDSILIRGITLRNPASWNQQYDQCRHLLVEDQKVDSKSYWNNDGIDVVDCSDVVIRNCVMDAADDVFCFKSHSTEGVSENILVEHCTGRSSANGIKFGTFTRGTMRHFRFRDITIYDTYRSAITIASVDGGHVEDIEIDGLRAYHTGNPIFLRFSERRKGTVEPCLKDIVLRNIYCEVPFEKPDRGYNYEGPIEDLPRNVSPSSIVGTPGHRIKNVLLENVELVYPGRADEQYAHRSPSDSIPELETQYPEFSMFKELPAWGFYIRHADDIQFRNVTLRLKGEDYRRAVVAKDVTVSTRKGAVPFDLAKLKADQLRVVEDYVAEEYRDPEPAPLPPDSTLFPTSRLRSPHPKDYQTDRVYNASMFGVCSDGTTLNTSSIQYAIDYIAQHGGGTLRFQVGRYLLGTVMLKSGVNIQLDEGAILVGSDNPFDYDLSNSQIGILMADAQVKNVSVSGLGFVELPRHLMGRIRDLRKSNLLPSAPATFFLLPITLQLGVSVNLPNQVMGMK